MGAQSSKPPERTEMAEKTGVYARRAAGLTAVPEKVWAIANLRTLDLSENKLPAENLKKLGGLSKLKTLAIDSNKLSSLPAELCTLNDLQSLSAAKNSLTALPDALGALGKLKTLNLSHNSLSSLPESMCAMVSLQTLDCSANKLQALPAGFGHLAALPTADTLADLVDADGGVLVWFVAGGDCTRAGDLALPAQGLLAVDATGNLIGRLPGATLTGNIMDVFGDAFVGSTLQRVDDFSDEGYFVTHMNVVR